MGEVSAFVLAGGRSSRMGADKAFLPLGGNIFLSIALRNARAVCPEPLIVGEAARYAAFGMVVEDRFRGCGPLGGIHAALCATKTEWNLMLSVDLPLMVPEFLGWIVNEATSGEQFVTVPRRNGRCEPLCAVYRPAVLPVIEQALHAGDFRVDRIFSKVPTRYVSEADVHSAGFHDEIFRNVNTPEDYELVKRQLRKSEFAEAKSAV